MTLVWFKGRMECKMEVFVSEMWIANGLMPLSAEMMLRFENMGVIFVARVVRLSEKLVD